MQMHVSFDNFRCFAQVGPIRIAPITVLVGENSSGKTSFLAGVREIVEAFGDNQDSPFNREPYYLGSFEQIAHYRGGRGGRAKTFTLTISEAESGTESLNVPRRRPTGLTHSLTFSRGDTQPEVTRYSVRGRNVAATFDLAGTKVRGRIETDSGSFEVGAERSVASELIRRDVSFLWYFLQDVIRSASGSDHTTLNEEQFAATRRLAALLRKSTTVLERKVFASAPVRIQPRRVYTPSELSVLNAGEQVPLQIANLKMSAPDKWAEAKAKLVRFGREANLFEDVEIKRFGKSTSDPFQLQIKHHGPAANIVDVGYGVSQALPLLFPLQAENDYNFYLLQQPEVHLHPRAQAEFGSLIARLSHEWPDTNYMIETHSDFVIDRIRAEVREGRIEANDVSILLFRREGPDTNILQLGLDTMGDITNCPEDYRSFFLEEQARALGL